MITCPRCEDKVPEYELKEYDPGERVCKECREDLGQMDYYSGAGDW